MPEVYLTAEGARELILSLQEQLKACMKVIDEAIALAKARTAERDAYLKEADASHALAIHNWKVANRLDDELKQARRERDEWQGIAEHRALELRELQSRSPHA